MKNDSVVEVIFIRSVGNGIPWSSRDGRSYSVNKLKDV